MLSKWVFILALVDEILLTVLQHDGHRRRMAPPRYARFPFHRLLGLPLIVLVLDYKFDLMYSKRAFVHWYVGEGMEEVRPCQYNGPLCILAYSP
jgi:hypothetical protein